MPAKQFLNQGPKRRFPSPPAAEGKSGRSNSKMARVRLDHTLNRKSQNTTRQRNPVETRTSPNNPHPCNNPPTTANETEACGKHRVPIYRGEPSSFLFPTLHRSSKFWYKRRHMIAGFPQGLGWDKVFTCPWSTVVDQDRDRQACVGRGAPVYQSAAHGKYSICAKFTQWYQFSRPFEFTGKSRAADIVTLPCNKKEACTGGHWPKTPGAARPVFIGARASIENNRGTVSQNSTVLRTDITDLISFPTSRRDAVFGISICYHSIRGNSIERCRSFLVMHCQAQSPPTLVPIIMD